MSILKYWWNINVFRFYKSGELSDLEMDEESDYSDNVSKEGLGKWFSLSFYCQSEETVR